jgi:DNA modification methylase
MIQAGCPADGVVLDPFMGSGTTAIEAIYQGKRYIGIDLNSDYCAMAAKRIDAELEQTVIELT